MKSQLYIKSFKRISHEVSLMDLSTINYIVGKNGSGKSSILNAISYFNTSGNNNIDTKDLFTSDSNIHLLVFEGDKYHEASIEFDTRNEVVIVNSEHPFKVVLTEGSAEMFGVDLIKYSFDYSNINEEKFQFINKTLEHSESSPIEAILKQTQSIWSETPVRRALTHHNLEINPQLLAQGYKSLNSLRSIIFHEYLNNSKTADIEYFFILIEEPENNLHPSLQKKIPFILNELINSFPKNIQSKIQFFISTHSPFLIGAASDFDDQKVYIVEDGFLVDVNNKLAIGSEGYKGSECNWVVSKMLGAEITDLGYPINYCIVEEYSMQIILDECVGKGLIKNMAYVSASGESNVIKIIERFDNFQKVNTLVKCYTLYADKYFVILDATENFHDQQK